MRTRRHGSRGYTLIELLAAMATLCLVLLMLFSTTGMATLAWKENALSTETFQQARTAFATMTRRLGQSTLNSYRDYYNTSSRNFDNPVNGKTEFRFRSDLNFLTGQARDLFADASVTRPTQAVFFQAPLGYRRTSGSSLRSTLNVGGYYVECGSEATLMGVQTATNSSPERSRLYEVLQPSEDFALYLNPNAKGRAWLTSLTAASSLPKVSHVLAENVIALILLPQRSSGDVALAPRYAYDSRAWQSGRTDLGELTQNQLPPLLQVTLVVIDEPSAKRLQESGQLKMLVDPGLFQDASQFDADWHQLEEKLKPLCRYRCFQTTVSLAASTWSE